MQNVNGLFAGLLVSCLSVLSCGGSQKPPDAPPEGVSAPQTPAEPSPDSAEETPARAEITAEGCEQSGGTVVGDIGDGAIHRPDYRCPSGAEPSGSIRSSEGGPMGVEGSVCCPK